MDLCLVSFSDPAEVFPVLKKKTFISLFLGGSSCSASIRADLLHSHYLVTRSCDPTSPGWGHIQVHPGTYLSREEISIIINPIS